MEAIVLSRKNVTLDPIEQSVIKKKVSLPANKIITKEYSPDVKPLVKLMYLFNYTGPNSTSKKA